MLVTSCEKTFKSRGTITGYDPRFCLCSCGGCFIEINAHTYRFYPEQLPPNSLNLDEGGFPINVMLDWETESQECGATDVIRVTRISKSPK